MVRARSSLLCCWSPTGQRRGLRYRRRGRGLWSLAKVVKVVEEHRSCTRAVKHAAAAPADAAAHRSKLRRSQRQHNPPRNGAFMPHANKKTRMAPLRLSPFVRCVKARCANSYRFGDTLQQHKTQATFCCPKRFGIGIERRERHLLNMATICNAPCKNRLVLTPTSETHDAPRGSSREVILPSSLLLLAGNTRKPHHTRLSIFGRSCCSDAWVSAYSRP